MPVIDAKANVTQCEPYQLKNEVEQGVSSRKVRKNDSPGSNFGRISSSEDKSLESQEIDAKNDNRKTTSEVLHKYLQQSTPVKQAESRQLTSHRELRFTKSISPIRDDGSSQEVSDMSSISSGCFEKSFSHRQTSFSQTSPESSIVSQNSMTRRGSPYPLLIEMNVSLEIARQAKHLTPLLEENYSETMGERVDEETFTCTHCRKNVSGKKAFVVDKERQSPLPPETEGCCCDRRTGSFIVNNRSNKGNNSFSGIMGAFTSTLRKCTDSPDKSRQDGTEDSDDVDKKRSNAKAVSTRYAMKGINVTSKDIDSDDETIDSSVHKQKFLLKRDSIAVTKVRMLKTQSHPNSSAIEEGDEEEEDTNTSVHEPTKSIISKRGNNHHHSEEHVRFVHDDSGCSVGNNSDSFPPQFPTDTDGTVFISVPKSPFSEAKDEVRLALNVKLRALRSEGIREEEKIDIKSLAERKKQLNLNCQAFMDAREAKINNSQ